MSAFVGAHPQCADCGRVFHSLLALIDHHCP